MYKPALISGSIFAMLSVVLGAFGAHYLKTIFTPEILSSFETGVKYQMYHSLALLFTGIISMNIHQKAKLITILFITGIVLFSGSIYALCILKSNLQIGLGGLGILTPIGGLFFIMGWGLLALNIAKSK
jgi:uncharacterized membrane protein YgdD (TMEM256/DUF423 family)